MHFLCTVGIQEIHGFLELSAAHDGVIHKQKALVFDQLMHGDLLHSCHLGAVGLLLRCKATRPGRRILDIRTGEGHLGAVRIANGVRNTGIRHAADVIQRRSRIGFLVHFCHDLTVAVAHGFYVNALVDRGGITVIRPKEGAHFHLLAGRIILHNTVLGRKLHDLARAKLARDLIAQLLRRKRFKGYGIAVLSLAHDHRNTAHLIACRQQMTVLLQDQDRASAVNDRLRKFNALGKAFLLVDQCGNQLNGVDSATRHSVKVSTRAAKIQIDQLFGVINNADGADRVRAVMRANEHGLGVCIADTADGRDARHLVENIFKLGAEGGTCDAVDLALQTDLGIVCRKSTPLRAQMGMIVSPEEHVQKAILC